MERSILLLLLFAVAANAARILPRSGICAKTCAQTEIAKFKFQPGRDYHYDFSSNTLTGLVGNDKQSSGLRMNGKASFEVISPCEMVLRMRDVRTEELSPEDGSFVLSSRHADFKAAMERHELHFSFNDGTISDLCPVKEEMTWVLNFKRGILSMLQNTMQSLNSHHNGIETDVTGDCKVRYTLTPNGIRREKNLLTCSGRENRQSALQSIPYFVRSETQAAPLTLSTHVCHQTISRNGHMEKVVCEEEHRLRSISKGQRGARTSVTQSITFIGDSDSQVRTHAHSHRRTTLKFDFEQKTKRSQHALKEAQDFLREVCAKSREDIRPETPRFFTEIVYRLRRLNARELKNIFSVVDRRKLCRSNNEAVRRLVIDAIPLLGNSQSMALMKNMIIVGRVSNIEANLWLTSLAFVQQPTQEMLTYLQPLLDVPQPRSQAVLGLSAMVHQYCVSRRECYTEPAVQNIGRSLRRLLNGDCSTKQLGEQTTVLLALKAIGNAGVFSVVSPDLMKCIANEENPMVIRVAATEAFRRMDCKVNRKPLIDVYKKDELDSELRINAYLAIMTCPNEEVLEIVKTQLSKEKVNQVGSFVWTHLTNLAETNDPLRKHLKNIVEDVKLSREFKLDKLKFSRNIEKSAFFNSINAGGRMESNVIWSQKSFLPRSLSLNLTSHLFGRSYNFLEFNGRIEGLETVLERYFGPDGYFKKEAENKTSALSNKDFQFMDNKFKLQNDGLRAGLGFKVFGHEVAFLDLFAAEQKPKKGFNFLEILIKLASHQEMDWSKNIMFLDSRITIPTISGLPLELSINGTASMSVKAKGKLDIRRMVSWPSTFDIDGTVQPSGSVEVSAMMGVNAYYTRHGLKLVSNVHSSTQIDAKLMAKDSETFKVDFGMPRNKQEIVNFESKFYVVHRNTEREHSLPNVRRINRRFCTGKGFEQSTGAELCATIRSPAISSFHDLLTLPVVGPFSASVALYKRDTHTSYRLTARWQRKKHRFHNNVYYSRFAHFEVNTPNSRVSRKHMLDFSMDYNARAISLHVENPQKRIGFSGAFTNTMGRKELKLSFVKDTTAYFHVSLSNRVIKRGLETILIPSFKVMIPGIPHISLQTRIVQAPGRYNFNLELQNLLRGPLTVGGSSVVSRTTSGETAVDISASMKSHFFVGSLSQSVRRGRDALTTGMNVRYGRTPSSQHSAQVNSNLQYSYQGGQKSYSFSLDHQISQWAGCRSKSLVVLKYSHRNAKLVTNVAYGENLKKTVRSEIFLRAERNGKGGVTSTLSTLVKVPHLDRFHSGKINLNIKPDGLVLITNYRHTPGEKTFKLVHNIRFVRTENMKLTWDLTAHFRKQYQLMTDMEIVRYPNRRYTLIANGDFNSKTARIESILEIPKRRQVDLTANIKVAGHEIIKVDTKTNIEPRNPAIVWIVDRNGDRYSINANYKFEILEFRNHKLTFSSQWQSPEALAKSDGTFQTEDTNFDGRMTVQWGPDSDNLKKMVIETSHELTEDGSKKNRNFELKWNHPARQGHIQVGLEKEDYKGSMHLELQTESEKQFVVDSMYEIDDGWTQKGLMASITVKTPIKKFERTHLGVNLLGRLRYRKAEVNFMWGNNKRIVTTLVIRPTGGTNFLATLKIITPFARYSYMRFHLKNELTGNQVQSELISEIGTKKTYLKVHGVNNGDYYMNDLAMTVSMNSPFDNFRDVMLTIDHKDDSNQYNSKLEFKWNKDKKITTLTNFNYNRNGVEIRTSGVVTYTTPFEEMKRGSIEWQHQNTKAMVKSEVNVEYLPDKKIGMTLNGLITEPETGAVRITGKSTITSTDNGKIEADFLHHHTPNSLNLRAICELPEGRSYEFQMKGNKEAKRIDGSININTPHDNYRKIGALLDIKNEDMSKILKSFIYAGNTKTPLASINGKLTVPTAADPSMSISAAFKNRIVKNIEVSIAHQHTVEEKGFNSISELTYAPGKSLSLTNELSYGSTKKFKTLITTPFQKFRTFLIGFDHEGNLKRFQHSHFIAYNNAFDLAGNVRFEGVNNMVAESKLSYRGFHYIRLSHKKNGEVFETNGILTFDTSKTIQMKSEVQVDPRLNVNVKLTTPFDVVKNVQVKLNAQGSTMKSASEPLVVLASAAYTFRDKVVTLNGLWNMKDTKDIRATLEIKTPFENIRDVSILLQHTKNGREYQTSVIGKSEDGRVEVVNIFQREGTLKNKFVIKTPLEQFKGITFSFEHRGRFPKVSHRHHLSFDIAGLKAKLNNKFDVFKLRLIEVESKFRSNVKMIKKAGFRFTFDKPIGGIETGLLIEWPQDKVEGRIAFKSSPENKVQLKISTPFYYFKELQGLYTLQNRGIKKFKHHIILAFKNELLTVGFENSLTIRTVNYIDAQLKINTPVDALKNFQIFYHHEILKRGKTFEARGEYNDNKYSLKGLYTNLPIHVVDLTLETPHEGVKSINSRSELILKDKTNWKFTSELFSPEMSEKLTFNADLKKEPTAIEARQSLSQNGKILNEVSLKTSWEDDKMYTGSLIIMNKMLPKSEKIGQMIFIETTADLRKAISVRATLRTPFENVENQWVTLRFERNEFLKADTMKTGNLLVKGSLMSKNAMLQARYSYGKRPSFQVLLQLPELQDMKLEGSLVMSKTNSYLKASLNVPDYLKKPWNLMVDLITTKTTTVSFKLDTSVKQYETIAGRASVSKQDRFVKVSGRLSMPVIKKPIEFNIEGDLRNGLNLVANLRGPVVRYFRSNLRFTGDAEKFELSTELFSNYLDSPFSSNLKFLQGNGFKIEGSIRTPLEVLKRLLVEASLKIDEMSGYIEIDHNKLQKPIRAEGNIDKSGKNFRSRFVLKTPFEKAKHTQIKSDFEMDGYKIITKFEAKTTAMEGKILGKLKFNYEKPKINLKVNIETPFEQLKQCGVTLKLMAQKDVNGRIMLTHNKLAGEITGRIELQAGKSIEVEVSTPFVGWYKHLQLSSKLHKIDKRYKLTSSISYYPANVISAIVQAEVSLPKVYLTYNIATPYKLLRQSYGTMNIKAVKNFLLESEFYHNALKEKVTLYIRANDAETKTLKIQWNAPVEGALKDIGVRLYFTRKPGAFEILKTISLPLQFSTGARINYHMNKEMTFSTSFDVTSAKKFDIKVQATSPFEIMKKTSATFNVDVQKNVLIVAEVAHNKLPEKISTRLYIDVTSRTFFLRLNTPFDGPHKRITVDGLIKKVGEKHQYEITAVYNPSQKFSLTGEIKPSITDLSATFKFTSPFEVMKEMSGKLTFSPKAKPMLYFEINHNKLPSKIEGRLHFKPFQRLKVILKIPVDGPFSNILIDYRLKKKGDKEVAIAIVKYNPNQVIRAELSFKKLEKLLDAKFKLSTPFEVMKKMHLTFGANWEKDITSSAQLSHNKLTDSFHVEINYSKKKSHLVQVVVKTPFDKLKNLDVKGTYQGKGTEHKLSLTVIYNKSKTTEIYGFVNLGKDMKEASLGMKTPLKGIWNSMSISGQYKREAQKHTVYVKTIYDSTKTIEVTTTVNTDINDLEISYSLKTPFEIMSFTEGKLTLKSLSTKYLRAAVPDKRVIGELEFIHPKLMEGKKLKVKADSKMGANEKNVKVDITVMDKTYDGKIYYKKKDARHTIGASVVTDKPDRPWFFEADIKANAVTDWEITASATSPKHRLDVGKPGVFKINAKHSGDLQKFENSLDVTSPYKKDLKYTGSFSKSAKTAKFNLKAPMIPTEKIELKHKGGIQSFKTSVKISLKNKPSPIDFSAEMSTTSEKMEAKIILKTPFDSWKENSLSITDEESTARALSTRNSLIKLDFSSSKLGVLKIVNDYKRSPSGITNDFSMDNNLKETKAPKTLKIKLEASPVKIDESSATLTIETSALKEKITLSAEWKKTSDSLKSTFKIDAIKDFLKSKVTLDIPKMKIDDSMASVTLSSEALKEPVKMSVNWRKSATSFDAKVESDMPVKFLKSKVTISIPKMMIEESDASLTVESEDLKEPAKLRIYWKKSPTFFQANINSKLPVKYLNSEVEVRIPMMTVENSEAYFTLKSKELKEPVTFNVKWLKSVSKFSASIESKIPVKYMKSKISVEIAKMMIEESDAALTITSEELKEPATISITWKKTPTSLTASIDSKLPIKSLKATTTIKMPVMTLDETDASVTITSDAMEKPAAISLKWKKTATSLEGSLKSEIDVKYLQSEISIKIPKMEADNAKATVTVTSKEMSEPAEVTVEWKNEVTKFKGSIESKMPVKFLKSKVELNIPKMFVKNTDATLTVTSTDLSEPCKLSVSWELTKTSFTVAIDSQVPVKPVQFKTNVKVDPMSPKDFKATFELEAKELSDKVKLDLLFKKSPQKLNTEFNLETPVEAIKKVNAIFFYDGDVQVMSSGLQLAANKLGSFESSVKWNNYKKEGNLNINVQNPSGARRYRRSAEKLFSLSMVGDRSKMTTTIEMPKSKTVKKIELATVRTMNKFDTSLKWDDKKVELMLNRIEESKILVTIKTSFEELKQLDFEITFPMKKNEMEFSVKVTHPKGSTLAFVSGKKDNGLKLTGKIENDLIPKVPSMYLTVDHQGKSAKKFKNIIDLKYAEKEGQITTTFDTQGKVAGSIEIKTPFEKFEKQSAQFEFVKSKPKLSAKVESSFGSASLDVVSSSSPVDQITSTLKFNKKVYQGIVKYSGNAKSFKSTVRILEGASRVRRSAEKELFAIQVNSDVKDSSYEGSVELKCNYLPKNYQSISALVKANGDFKTFKKLSLETSAIVEKVAYISTLKWDHLKSGSVSIKFPGEKQGCVISAETSVGLTKGVEVKSSASKCDGEIYNFNFNSNLKDELKASLKSSHEPSNTDLEYKHTIASKTASGEIKFNNQKLGEYKGLFIASWTKDITANLKIEMPENKNAELDLKVSGPPKKMNIETTLTLPNGKTLKGKLNWVVSKESPISIDFSLETPFDKMKKTEVSLKHANGEKFFSTKLSFKQSYLGDYSTSLSYDGSNSAKIIFTLNTPHEILKDLKFLFNYEGKISEKFDQSIFVTYNGVKSGYSLELILKKLLYRLEIDTPFEGFKKIVISNEHNGDAEKFTHKIKMDIGPDNIVEFNMNHHATKDGYKGNWRFKSPFKNFENIHLKIDHKRGSPTQWLMNHKLTYAPGKVIHCQGIINHGLPALSAVMTLKTPFPKVEVIEVSLQHKHDDHYNFNFQHDLKVNKKMGTFRGRLNSKEGKVIGLVMLDTPFSGMKHFDANFRHEGGLRKFENDMAVTYTIGRTISVKTRFDITKPKQLKAEMHLDTPFERLRTGTLVLKHSGTWREHFQQLKLGANGKEIVYKGVVSVKEPKNMFTEHTFTTPFKKFKSLNIKFDHNNGIAHLDLTWNKVNFVKVVGLLSRKKFLLAELTVATSFQNLKKSSLKLKNAGTNSAFDAQGALNINGAESNINLRFKRDLPELSLETRFPKGAQYAVNVGVQKIKDTLEGKLKISKDNKEIVKFIGNLKYDFIAPSKMMNLKLNGVLPISGPNEMKVELAFSGNKEMFVVFTKSEFFEKHRISTMLNYDTYKKIFGEVKYNDRPYSLGYIFAKSADLKDGKNLAVEMVADKIKGGLSLDVNSERVELEIRTPFKKAKEIFLMVHHKQKSKFDFVHRSIFTLNKHRYVNFDLSVDSKSGTITMKAPAVMTIKYSMSGQRVVRAILEIDPDKNDASKKMTFNAFVMIDNDASLNKTSHEASFTMVTKYRDLRLETKTTIAPKSFFHKTSINPDQRTNKPWKVILSTFKHLKGHKSQRTDDWVLETPVRALRVFMDTQIRKGKLVNDLDFHWDNRRSPVKKMGWKLKVEQRGKENIAVITFHHPVMRDGVSLRTRSVINSGNSIIRARANFRYSDNPQEAIDFALKVSRAGQKMLRGSMSIKQEATELDTKLTGDFGGNRGIYINGLTLSHRMNKKTKVFQISSHVNVLKGSVMLELVTPVRTFSWMSVANYQTGSFTYQLNFDKSKKAYGKIMFSKSPSFNARLYLNPGNTDNYIETYGKFANKKHFELKIHRMMSNRRFSDFVFTLKLKGEHLLKSRLFWRPSLLAEAQRYVKWQVEEMKKNAKEMWPQFAEAVRKEWTMKKNLIIATIPNFDKFSTYTNNELVLVKDDLYKIAGIIYDNFMDNDFYLRDIVTALVKYATKANEKAKVMRVAMYQAVWGELMPNMYARLQQQPGWRRLQQSLRRSTMRLAKAARALSRNMNAASGIGKHHINRGVEKLTRLVKSMHQVYSHVEKRAFAHMRLSAIAARQHYARVVQPRIDRMRTLAVQGLKSLSNYHRNSKESILDHFNGNLRAKLSMVHATIQRGIDNASHRYGILFHSLRQRMNRRLNGTLDFKNARYASDIIKSGIKQIQWAYDQFDVEQKLKDYGHSQYLKAVQYVKENSIDVIRDYLRLDQNRLTFQPEKGRIEGQIYVPFEMTDLQSKPDWSNFRRTTNRIRKAFKRPSSIRITYLPSIEKIKQRIMRYIPNIEKDPRAWIPTFRGYASIAGKHIVTFDKVHYDLDGNCNYVLSRDYKGGKWAVVLNQATKNRHITIVAYNKKFSIFNDHSVTVDGRKVELPFVYRNLSILRFGPIIKAKDTVLGFSVTSDVVNDIHTVGVVGWYHGKLGGLFGNFDNEPYNDMQTIDHKISVPVDTFIQSWALLGCQHNNNVGQHNKAPSKIATKVCKFLFGCPLSPMAKCFKHVDAKPFLKLCLSDVDEMSTGNAKSRICRAARLYAYHCKKAHVKVRVPLPCRWCNVPGRNSIKEDQSVTIRNTKATADVVFVVEESPCNKDVVPRLSDIVRRMELVFKRRGITDNRYGLIGFGRKVHGLRWSHTHTINSQLMGEAESFTTALKNFELDEINATDTYDPLRAIRKASQYPLRPGASRQIIFVPCTSCIERDIDAGEIEDELKDQDIVLFILGDHEIRIRRPSMSPLTNYLFGVDRRAVFTQKDIKNLRWDRRLHRQVIRPRDICTQIAYSTGGAVFNSGKLTRMHVDSQSWFKQVFANRVAASSNSPQTVDCECSFTERDQPHLICKRNGAANVRGNPQPIPLPIALPASERTNIKLEYRR